MTEPELAGSQPVRAAVYCRLSLSRHGDTTHVDDQERLCRKVADQRGWTVPDRHVYKDNSRSAWKRNRKRPRWDAMLAAVSSGEVDAIVVYHGDRLIRQPWDLELLLRLADQKGIRLASPTGERDLDNPDDRFILRIEAAQACRESDNTSRRTRWYYAKRREKGEVVRLGGRGGRCFGYDRDGRTVIEAEAAAVRRAAARVRAGEGVGQIARDLNRQGMRTTAGNLWDHGTLKKLLLRPRIAGLVEHEGAFVDAVWPALLGRDEWEEVRTILTGRASAYGYATNARTYQLSGIAECGVCGSKLAIRHNNRARHLIGYGCINPDCPRKVYRNRAHLDAYVDGAMVELANDPRVRRRMASPVSQDLILKLRQAEEHKRAVLERAAEQDVDPQTAADMLAVTVTALNRRIDDLREQIRSMQGSNALDGLWGMDLERWRQLPLSRRRAAIAATLRVVVHPSTRRGPGFDESSVELRARV